MGESVSNVAESVTEQLKSVPNVITNCIFKEKPRFFVYKYPRVIVPKSANRLSRRTRAFEYKRIDEKLSDIEGSFLTFIMNWEELLPKVHSYEHIYNMLLEEYERCIERNKFEYTSPNTHYFAEQYAAVENGDHININFVVRFFRKMRKLSIV